MSSSRIENPPSLPNTYSLGRDLAHTVRRALLVTAVIFAALGLIAILANARNCSPLIKLLRPLNLKNALALTLICSGSTLLLALPELLLKKNQPAKIPEKSPDISEEKRTKDIKALQELYPVLHADPFKTVYSAKGIAKEEMQKERNEEIQIENHISIFTAHSSLVDINRYGALSLQGREILKGNPEVPIKEDLRRIYTTQEIYNLLGSETLTEVALTLFDQQALHPFIMHVFADLIDEGKNPKIIELAHSISYTNNSITFTLEHIFEIWEVDPIEGPKTFGYKKIRVTYRGKKKDFEARNMDSVTCKATASRTFTDLESARKVNLKKIKKKQTFLRPS